ncbi:MAG: Clp protease N-terminal domain-containing protein, partial [Hyphomicrobiaceae bacterium]
MAQTIVDEIGQILPPTRNLAETLGRAADYATQQGHRDVSLEHLLLALTEDPDAGRVMMISRVAIEQLKGDVATHLGHVEERSEPGDTAGISPELRQVLEAAAAAASGRRSAIDGAIVLAAIVGDGRSTAAHLLRAHGLTFEEAIKALQSPVEEEPRGDGYAGAASATRGEADVPARPGGDIPAPARPVEQEPARRFPQDSNADEILASARQRVEGRFAPGLPDAEEALHQDEIARQSPVSSGDAGPAPEPPVQPEGTVLPAPAGKRPSPPGAIRPRGKPDAGPGTDSQSSGPVMDDSSQSTENSIDEVLASIRLKDSGSRGSIAVPPGAHFPTPPQKPISDAPGVPSPREQSPRAGQGQPSLHQPANREDGSDNDSGQRPSDQDFFGGRSPGRRKQRPPVAAPAPPTPAASPSGPPGPPLGPPSGGGPRPPLPGAQQARGRAKPGPGKGPVQNPRPPLPTGPQGQGAWPRLEPGTQRPPGAPPPPQQSGPPGSGAHFPPPASGPAPARAGGRPRQRSAEVVAGQLVENIPRVMRVGNLAVVEARIARAEVKALAEGLQGGGSAWRHDLTVTKAMSVRLRAPDGGFFIETNSPETQWIENTLGFDSDDYASWRWSVTPKE